ALASAQREAVRVRREAREEATAELDSARTESAQLRAAAREQVEQARVRVASLSNRRESIEAELRGLKGVIEALAVPERPHGSAAALTAGPTVLNLTAGEEQGDEEPEAQRDEHLDAFAPVEVADEDEPEDQPADEPAEDQPADEVVDVTEVHDPVPDDAVHDLGRYAQDGHGSEPDVDHDQHDPLHDPTLHPQRTT
ncbi:ATP synthase subunit B family protein, partial [Angustibacter speluncae]